MKKTLTLVMLFVFLLNVLGMYGVFMGVKLSNKLLAIRAMDDNSYSLSNAKTFKIPLTVAYYSNQSDEYQRVDGEFEHEGEVYRMVKQKISNDTLYVMCVKDLTGKSINEAIEDVVKTFSDKPSSSKQTVKSLSFSKDYFSTSVNVESGQQGWMKSTVFVVSVTPGVLQSHAEIFSPPKAFLVG